MRKIFILVIALLLIFGISSAVMAQAENNWKKNFQKDFGNLNYLNQNQWGSNRENSAEIIQEANENSASIKQRGRGNNALISQLGSNNQAQIIQD